MEGARSLSGSQGGDSLKSLGNPCLGDNRKVFKAHQKCMGKWNNGILKNTALLFVLSPL